MGTWEEQETVPSIWSHDFLDEAQGICTALGATFKGWWEQGCQLLLAPLE